LHRHHQHKTTIKDYVTPVVRFLVALLVPLGNYQFPGSAELNTALAAISQDDEVLQSDLHTIFLALWKTMWRRSKTNPMPDPTMCFVALASLKTTGEFLNPKDVTGVLAKFCRAIQLTMIQEIHQLVDDGICNDQLAAYETIACYVREKELSSFNSLMSLQHYATALAFRTMSLPRIWWVDRIDWHELLYLGQRITYQHICTVFQHLETRLIQLWEDKVMLGLNLGMDYNILSDNLLRTEPGYSFLQDDSNMFKNMFSKLGEAILKHPTLKKRFFTPDGHVNAMAAREWLVDLAEFEGLLMTDIDFKGGAPARATELTSMLMHNTTLRLRNVMALALHLSIVRQYDKTTNMAQGDRLIPHSINAVNADLLIRLHVLARPFAQVSHVVSQSSQLNHPLVSCFKSVLGQAFTCQIVW
jgi:bloom syndrome protein